METNNKKIAVYECNFGDKVYSKADIKKIYNIDNDDFDYYCDVKDINTGINNKVMLKKLKEDIKEGCISKVLVRSLNDVSYSGKDIKAFIEYVRKYNCQIFDIRGLNFTYFDILIEEDGTFRSIGVYEEGYYE